MTVLRSLLFGFAFYGGTIVIGFLYLPLILLPEWIGRPFFRFWIFYGVACAWLFAGIKYRVVYAEGAALADGPAIYASKHQSAWETMAFSHILPKAVFVLK